MRGCNLILFRTNQAFYKLYIELLHVATSLQNLFDGLSADRGNFFCCTQPRKSFQSRTDNIARVIGAQRLCPDIADSGTLNNRTNRAAGDNTGTRSSRLQAVSYTHLDVYKRQVLFCSDIKNSARCITQRTEKNDSI